MDEINVKITEFPAIRVSLADIAVNSTQKTTSHANLTDRDLADQHPISSITGLADALAHAGGASEEFFVNFEIGELIGNGLYTISQDRTPAEIAAAIDAGRPVVGVLNSVEISASANGSIFTFNSLLIFEKAGTFCVFIEDGGAVGLFLPDNLTVRITESSGTYSADRSFEEIYNMLSMGFSSRCIIYGFVLDLAASDSSTIVYDARYQGTQLSVYLYSDNTVDVKQEKFACQCDIPTDAHINSLIDAKLAEIPSASGVSF